MIRVVCVDRSGPGSENYRVLLRREGRSGIASLRLQSLSDFSAGDCSLSQSQPQPPPPMTLLRNLRVLLLVISLGLGASFAAEPGTDKIPPERFDAKVVKVYEAKDEGAIFRAYVVMWRGQQVIASDPLAKSNYKEGDTISVLAMNHPFPQGREPYRLLAFTVVPQSPGR